MEPFSLIFFGCIYYLARKNGNIKYRLSGHKELLDKIIPEIEKHAQEIDALDKNLDVRVRLSMKEEVLKKLGEYIALELSRSNFPRLKIYDLAKTLNLHFEGAPYTHHDLAHSVCKGLANRFDRLSKWQGENVDFSLDFRL